MFRFPDRPLIGPGSPPPAIMPDRPEPEVARQAREKPTPSGVPDPKCPNLAQQFDRAHERTGDHASTSLVRTAYLTRPAVEFMLSLRMAAARCVSVVFMLRSRIALTALLL